MENEHVTAGLIRKRQEIAGELEALYGRIAALTESLRSLDGAVRLFAPETALEEIAPRVPRYTAQPGEISRPIREALREAGRPLTVHELALKVMATRRMDTDDRAAVRLMQKRVMASLRNMQLGGAVESQREPGPRRQTMAGRMTTNQHLLSLREERERISGKINEAERLLSHLKGELVGIDRSIAIVKGLVSSEPPAGGEERLSRGALKEAVLGLLGEQQEGLRSSDLIDLARARGKALDRGSVASLLSRLARDNVILFDRETRRYRVKPVVPFRVADAGGCS